MLDKGEKIKKIVPARTPSRDGIADVSKRILWQSVKFGKIPQQTIAKIFVIT